MMQGTFRWETILQKDGVVDGMEALLNILILPIHRCCLIVIYNHCHYQLKLAGPLSLVSAKCLHQIRAVVPSLRVQGTHLHPYLDE